MESQESRSRVNSLVSHFIHQINHGGFHAFVSFCNARKTGAIVLINELTNAKILHYPIELYQPQTVEPKQLDLFSDIPSTPVFKTHQPSLEMSANALTQWKTRIFDYQQQAKATATQQPTLFELTPTHCVPDSIDPFNLTFYPMSFYRIPADTPGDACIYFVLDKAMPLLLYVGETCQCNKRWKGVHDCKRYIENYISLHRQYQLEVAICMTFWWDAPAQTKPRQQLELELIQKWKSPFNKENWQSWGTPFV